MDFTRFACFSRRLETRMAEVLLMKGVVFYLRAEREFCAHPKTILWLQESRAGGWARNKDGSFDFCTLLIV